MMKFMIVLLALAVVASAFVDVIPHYSHEGGHGVSSRYFRKSQGYGLGYGGYGYGGYGLGYGDNGLGYGGYGYGGYDLGYNGLGFGGYGL